jgi:hypothetical protein
MAIVSWMRYLERILPVNFLKNASSGQGWSYASIARMARDPPEATRLGSQADFPV